VHGQRRVAIEVAGGDVVEGVVGAEDAVGQVRPGLAVPVLDRIAAGDQAEELGQGVIGVAEECEHAIGLHSHRSVAVLIVVDGELTADGDQSAVLDGQRAGTVVADAKVATAVPSGSGARHGRRAGRTRGVAEGADGVADLSAAIHRERAAAVRTN
jgi:hypothetical protein